MDLRRLLAFAVVGVLTASCGSAGPSGSPAKSPAAPPSLAASPSTGPIANASCPGANSQISTDESMEALAAAQTASSAERALQTFLGQYKVKAVVLPFVGAPTNFTWDNLTDDDLPALIPYARLLICEYAKYSAKWVDSSRIMRVALVKHLHSKGVAVSGCGTEGVADYKSLTIYHNVECTSPWGVRIKKHALHHEFWHLMAYSVYGPHDPDWVALNDRGFVYGKAGWDPVTGWDPAVKPFHPRAGFVTAYAMYTEQEDQAETYASMLVNEDYTELRDWMTTDPILKSKVEYMRRFIKSIDPTMNLVYDSGQ